MIIQKSFRVRLIPVTILAASFLAGIKLVDVCTGAEPLFGIATARAASAPATPATPASVAATSAANVTTPAASASPTAPSAPTSGSSAASPATSTEAAPAHPAAARAASTEAPASEPLTYSRAEVEVLQGLAKRRDKLDARARALDLRQAMLAATAKKVDAKIATLEAVEKKLQALLHERDARDQKNMDSLVKVYENMKPQDAARIFEKLDMPILLDVAGRMHERKLAAILADMNPDKARSVTTELATWRATPPGAGPAAADAASAGQNG